MKKIMILLLMLFVSSADAESVAKVLHVSNKVSLLRNGNEKSVSRGMELLAGDTISTGAGALANFLYSNGTIVNLGENSKYTIVAYNPKSDDVQVKAKLSDGKLRFKTNGKTKEEITTPITTLAILGTDASVYVASAAETFVKVLEGAIKATKGTIMAGKSAVINSAGFKFTPFPKEGETISPKDAEGSISSLSSSSGSSTNPDTNKSGSPPKDLIKIPCH